MKILFISVIPLLLIGAVVACAGRQAVPVAPSPKANVEVPAAAPVSPEDALRSRVTRFWEARLKDDPATQYEFLDPEAKQRVTLTAYVRSRGTFHFLVYQVQSINIVGEKAWVEVNSTFKLRIPLIAGAGPWTQQSREVWTLRESVWYRPYDQKEAEAPPPPLTTH